MGFDINRFKDGSVKDEFICIICQEVFNNPVMIETCEHMFCDECIRGWIREKKECPIDRDSVSESQLRGSFRAFNNLLNDFEINCDYASNGCLLYIKLEHLKQHLISCEYNPEKQIKIKCDCDEEISKNEINSHQESCIKYLKTKLMVTKMQLTTITAHIADYIDEKIIKDEISNRNETQLKLIKQFKDMSDELDIKGEKGPIDQILIFLHWLYYNGITNRLIWDDLIEVTKNLSGCTRFLELNGLDHFALHFNAFPEENKIHDDMLTVIANILFYHELTPKLLDSKECIEIFIELTQSEDFSKSFKSVYILSYICAYSADIWCEKMPQIPIQNVLNKIKETFMNFKINQESVFWYSSFVYPFKYLKLPSLPPELQYRFLWVIAQMTRADCVKYCPMIEKENGIEVIQKIEKDRKTKFYVMKIASLVLFQYEKYKSCGNLNGIKDSDEMDINKLRRM